MVHCSDLFIYFFYFVAFNVTIFVFSSLFSSTISKFNFFPDSSDSIFITARVLGVCMKRYVFPILPMATVQNCFFDSGNQVVGDVNTSVTRKGLNSVQVIGQRLHGDISFLVLFFAYQQCHCCIATKPATQY